MKLKKTFIKVAVFVVAFLVFSVLLVLFLQTVFAHRNDAFHPDYPMLTLTEESDFETIFLQSGIGESAAKSLIEKGEFDKILSAQENFFKQKDINCREMIGFFTKEDTLESGKNTPFYELREGDIVVTLSTHSAGWRHGHAALVIDENSFLECKRIGTKTSVESVDYWRNYSNYAVLRVKNTESYSDVTAFALSSLIGVDYRLFSGIFEKKAQDINHKNFGLYCTNLTWYAWQQFDVDLDSDGGKIVTAHDLLHSENVEIVQLYGMNPKDFM